MICIHYIDVLKTLAMNFVSMLNMIMVRNCIVIVVAIAMAYAFVITMPNEAMLFDSVVSL